MFKKKTKKEEPTQLEKEIASVLEVMSVYGPDTVEYKTMSENLEKLHKAKAIDMEARAKIESSKKRGVSADTVLVVAGNLLGIGLILGYERLHVVTSKALGFILKGRV